MRQVRNVFETILKYGHDEDFAPVVGDDFVPTDAPAGSKEKIEALARRIEMGMPLWHPDGVIHTRSGASRTLTLPSVPAINPRW